MSWWKSAFNGISSTNAADQNSTIVKGLLGLENAPSTEIVARLLEIPIEDFLTKISPGISIGPVEDGDILPRQFTFGEYAQHVPQMPGTPQIESILLGYSKLDVSGPNILPQSITLPNMK